MGVLFGPLFTLIMTTLVSPFNALRAYRANPAFYDDLELSLDDTGIRVKGRQSNSQWHWSLLRGLKENKTIFLIMITKRAGAVVPKRVLSPEQAAEFRDTVTRKIAEARLRR